MPYAGSQVCLLLWLLVAVHLRGAWPIAATSSTINSHGRIIRSGSAGSANTDIQLSNTSDVTVFIVTTPDEQHVAMLKNLLCSLFSQSGGVGSHQEISVLLHPGHGSAHTTAEQLQQSFRSLGYSRLSVLDSTEIFGSHTHWKALKHGFPSNLRVFGIRYALAKMAPGSRLLVIDEDVVCSPERAARNHDDTVLVSIPDEIAQRAPEGASVVCAHEVPGVSDQFNNGFCMYTASAATDALLAAVERRMVDLKFSGDQTPFNQIVSEGADLVEGIDASNSSSFAQTSLNVTASDVVATFGVGTVGYLRTWTPDGYPYEHEQDLSVVDSAAPETLVKWDRATQSSSAKPLVGPLCVHYLPFSPGTHVWQKLNRQC